MEEYHMQTEKYSPDSSYFNQIRKQKRSKVQRKRGKLFGLKKRGQR